MAQITLKSDEHILGHIDKFVSASGQDAPVDGAVTWESSDTSAFTVNVTNNGMDVDIVATDMEPGAAQKTATLTMKADANMDPNSRSEINMTWDIVVNPAIAQPLAASANVTFSDPMKKA